MVEATRAQTLARKGNDAPFLRKAMLALVTAAAAATLFSWPLTRAVAQEKGQLVHLSGPEAFRGFLYA